MDPFSTEGELLNIHKAFHQGQYTEVLTFDTTSLSPENALTARVLKLRAKLALNQIDDVLSELEGEADDVPDLAAVRALAYEMSGEKREEALKEAERLAGDEKCAENGNVQVLCGTVLQAHGRSEEALKLLGRHQGNLEAVSLITQIHLVSNRTDLASKEVAAAKRWAQDALLVNLAESWVGLRQGGDAYQQAFYVFEELASVDSTSSAASLVGQAVAELHLGRLGEAEAALKGAVERYPENADVRANIVVCEALMGRGTDEAKESLKKVQPDHHLLTDLAEKEALFDAAAAKYTAKASAA
ncbi:hypothetical protein KEM55_006558 [Ascosphaera atra]|nr:hypothetical protein KEM55_006558 [Ascosphaera atra]